MGKLIDNINDSETEHTTIIRDSTRRIRLLSVIVVLLVLLGVYSWFKLGSRNKFIPKDVQSAYKIQAKKLISILDNIIELHDFVVAQKLSLEKSQRLLNELKSRRTELEPIVETDRKVVEAILQAGAKIRNREMWIDMIIGFLSGIIASLTAQLIWSFIKLYRTRSKSY